MEYVTMSGCLLLAALVPGCGPSTQEQLDIITDDIETVTGRPPRSFAQFARDHEEAFRSQEA